MAYSVFSALQSMLKETFVFAAASLSWKYLAYDCKSIKVYLHLCSHPKKNADGIIERTRLGSGREKRRRRRRKKDEIANTGVIIKK